MTDPILLQARELLITECRRSELFALAKAVEGGRYDDAPEIRAIIEALRTTEKVAEIDDVPCIDLDALAWESIKEAAAESDWIPKEHYTANDWTADVCEFLRHGDSTAQQPAEAGKVGPVALREVTIDDAKNVAAAYSKIRRCGWLQNDIMLQALQEIFPHTAAPVLPEVSQADVIAAWNAFNDNAAGDTMCAVLNCYRNRVMAK